MTRIEDLQTFVRVVEAGSISGAAERLGIAKSAASRRISELEERLGVQLIKRTTRRLSITDTGQSFYERCVRILADLEEAELAVSQEHGALKGRLRVAAPLSFGLLHLAPAINEFVSLHPELDFDLDFNDRRVDLLQEGFDVGIRIAKLEDSSLIARRLATVNHVVCASAAYLDANGIPQTPAALANHRCIVYSNAPEPGSWRYRAPDGVTGTVNVPVHMRANNGEFLTEAAIAGHGIVMEPDFIVYDALERGALQPLLTDHRWPVIDAWAIYPRTRHLSRRVRAFVDFLSERFAGVPYWQRWLQTRS